jgi:hypothetical protein
VTEIWILFANQSVLFMADKFWAHRSGAPNGLGVEDPIATKKRLKEADYADPDDPTSYYTYPTIGAGGNFANAPTNLTNRNLFKASLIAGVLREGGDFDASKPGAGYDAPQTYN